MSTPPVRDEENGPDKQGHMMKKRHGRDSGEKEPRGWKAWGSEVTNCPAILESLQGKGQKREGPEAEASLLSHQETKIHGTEIVSLTSLNQQSLAPREQGGKVGTAEVLSLL